MIDKIINQKMVHVPGLGSNTVYLHLIVLSV